MKSAILPRLNKGSDFLIDLNSKFADQGSGHNLDGILYYIDHE